MRQANMMGEDGDVMEERGQRAGGRGSACLQG
jgi:hypothetical protein